LQILRAQVDWLRLAGAHMCRSVSSLVVRTNINRKGGSDRRLNSARLARFSSENPLFSFQIPSKFSLVCYEYVSRVSRRYSTDNSNRYT
jgi:hypothetical protein